MLPLFFVGLSGKGEAFFLSSRRKGKYPEKIRLPFPEA